MNRGIWIKASGSESLARGIELTPLAGRIALLAPQKGVGDAFWSQQPRPKGYSAGWRDQIQSKRDQNRSKRGKFSSQRAIGPVQRAIWRARGLLVRATGLWVQATGLWVRRRGHFRAPGAIGSGPFPFRGPERCRARPLGALAFRRHSRKWAEGPARLGKVGLRQLLDLDRAALQRALAAAVEREHLRELGAAGLAPRIAVLPCLVREPVGVEGLLQMVPVFARGSTLPSSRHLHAIETL